MDKALVKNMLGALYAAKIAKTAGIAVAVVIGIILAALGTFFLFKHKQIKRLEDLGIADSTAYERMEQSSPK